MPTTIIRTFTMDMPGYPGLAASITYKVVLSNGTVAINTTGTGVTEDPVGAVYFVNIANFDTSWVGRIVWLESTTGTPYTETFTATQSADVAPGVAAIGTNGTKVSSYATGQDPATLLAASTPYKAAMNTAIYTNTNGTDFNTPNTLGENVKIDFESRLTATVTDSAPTASSFTITLDNGAQFPEGGFPQNLLKFTSGALLSATQVMQGFTNISGSSGTVGLVNGFTEAPANGDKMILF